MADTAPKPFVFVLMPFDAAFDDVYKLGIKHACEEGGAYCERVDEQIFDGTILARVYNQISKADIIVADMTGRNPNVFYEVGYAHALGKQVILATKNADDIPFDLKHYPHIVYSGKIVDLKGELIKRVRWFINNPQTRIETAEKDVELYMYSLSLKDLQTFKFKNPMKLDIHNPTPRTFPVNSFQIGLISSLCFNSSDKFEGCVLLPSKQNLRLFPTFKQLLPFAWDTVQFGIYAASKVQRPLDMETLVFRVFTDIGTKDYRVQFSMERPKPTGFK